MAHRLAADVDAERALLTEDLLRTGQVRQVGWAELATPSPEETAPDGTYYTDGRAAVLSTVAAIRAEDR